MSVTSTFREVVEFVDHDRVTRFGVVRKTYWLSDGEITDCEWLDTFDTRREAEAVMLAGVVEDEVAVMRER
jgi:hypothetical protein